MGYSKRTFREGGQISRCYSDDHARLRAFPPQAVLGPCFSTGWQSLISQSGLSRPFTGVLLWRRDGRRPVNEPDNAIGSSPLQPDVNVGPSTACGGKGRKRPLPSRNPHSYAPASARALDRAKCRGFGSHGQLQHILFCAVRGRGDCRPTGRVVVWTFLRGSRGGRSLGRMDAGAGAEMLEADEPGRSSTSACRAMSFRPA